MAGLPTGFLSHTDNSNREGSSFPAAPRKGSTPERTGGQNQKLDQTARHQLKPGSCSEGTCDTERSSRCSLLITTSVLIVLTLCFLRCQNAGLHGEGRCSDLSVRLPVAGVRLTSASQNLSLGRGKLTAPVCWTWAKVKINKYIQQNTRTDRYMHTFGKLIPPHNSHLIMD